MTEVGTLVLTSTPADDAVAVTSALSMHEMEQPAPALRSGVGLDPAVAAALSANAAASEPTVATRVRAVRSCRISLGHRRHLTAVLIGKPAPAPLLTAPLVSDS